MLVIDDSTPDHLFEAGPDASRGLLLEQRPNVGGYAYSGVAERFPDELLIPRHEWQARIEEMEQRKSRLSDLMAVYGLKAKNQNGTNHCWAYGPVQAVEILRCIQNQSYVPLSATSVACRVNGFKNQGGWGRDALRFIASHGIYPESAWPANQINRRYQTSAGDANALNYAVSEWWEMEPKNIDQFISCLLRRIPWAGGYAWWGHEIVNVDPVWHNGQVGTRIRNQWPNWGDDNFAILQGAKMLADDAVAPRVAVAA